MGLDYSFEFMARRDGVDGLLRALARRLGGGYARALRRCLPWSPAQPGSGDAGIAGLRPCFAVPNYYDVVVLLAVDDEVRRYFAGREAPIERHMERGKAGVGLVYMKLYAGAEHALLSLTAATTNMSVMLAVSQSAREAMLQVAREGKARALFLDDEQDGCWDLLRPLPRGVYWRQEVPRPRRPRWRRPEEVDEYCEQALALAGLREGSTRG